jgi:hypothetical protein
MAMRNIDSDLGVNEWWTPVNRRRPEHSGPRTDDEGRKVPAWFRDDETESQQWLAAQGVMLDA